MADEQLQCRECGTTFLFTVAEQDFFREKGFDNKPTRCKPCNSARKQAARGQQTCYNCGQPGHMSRECPAPPSGGRGGYSAGGYSAGGRGGFSAGGGAGRGACYRCGQEGHMSRECPNAAAAPSFGGAGRGGFGGGAGRGGVCYKCGQPGHISRDCTQ